MKKILLVLSVLAGLLMTSCGSTRTRGSLYPNMYEEHPVTILVLPPINNTTNVDAKELLYTSISYPLIEAGYYVVPPHLAMEFLKAESGYDAEMFFDKDAAIFAQVFGADAVIFSVVDKWQKSGFGIQTNITYIVKSTKTNEILFERRCDLYLDLSSDSGNKSTLGALIDLAASAINTATTDHIVAARKCNKYIFQDIPRGKYSPEYQKDKDKYASDKNVTVTVK